MKIEVKNFGPIKKGAIDLDKRVTVFVGYNNSGKTYMSQLLWGLNSNKYSFEKYLSVAVNEKNISNEKLEITQEIVSKLIDEFSSKLSEVILPEWFKVDKNYFKEDNLSILFKGDVIDIFRTKEINVLNIVNDDKAPFGHIGYQVFKKSINSLEVSLQTIMFETSIDSSTLLKIREKLLSDFGHPEEWFISHGIVSIEKSFTSVIAEFMRRNFFNIYTNSFFLPANRVFYPSYYKYIYGYERQEYNRLNRELQNNNIKTRIETVRNVPYTMAVNEVIDSLYHLGIGLEENDVYEDLLSELKVLIGGDIGVYNAEGFGLSEFTLKLDNKREIEMFLSSSSVNQLATLYLYFKYWAKEENNYLIIDEPEENLHPENQIKLVNILMKFADRNNNKVLITTHSPLITDHINNYANLSYLKESGTDVSSIVNDEFTHMADIQTIKHSDYGVYFFNGSEIEEYEVGNYGAYFEDFQKAENKVKETSNTLKNSIYDNINNNARKSFQNKSK